MNRSPSLDNKGIHRFKLHNKRPDKVLQSTSSRLILIMTLNTAYYVLSHREKSLPEHTLSDYQLLGLEDTFYTSYPSPEPISTSPWQAHGLTRRGPYQSTPCRTSHSTHSSSPWSPQKRSGGPIIYSDAPIREPPNSATEFTPSAHGLQSGATRPPQYESAKAKQMEIRCWEHGCEGRKFSSLGNYRRHLREKNGQAKVYPCPECGRVFTRSTARNYHKESGTCGQNPRQLMLQMQMGLIPSETHFLSSPPLTLSSAVPLEELVDSNCMTEFCSAPADYIWGQNCERTRL